MPVTQQEAQEFFQQVAEAASPEDQQALIQQYVEENPDDGGDMLAAVVQQNPASAQQIATMTAEAIPEQANGTPYKNQFQKARHLITGLEYDVSNTIDFQLEGYLKDFSQLTNLNRNMTSDNENDQFIIESGISKGKK